MLSSSVIEMYLLAFVSNSQDVCRSECSRSIKKEPNEFNTQNEVNNFVIS